MTLNLFPPLRRTGCTTGTFSKSAPPTTTTTTCQPVEVASRRAGKGRRPCSRWLSSCAVSGVGGVSGGWRGGGQINEVGIEWGLTRIVSLLGSRRMTAAEMGGCAEWSPTYWKSSTGSGSLRYPLVTPLEWEGSHMVAQASSSRRRVHLPKKWINKN